jgi:hypothetical protein
VDGTSEESLKKSLEKVRAGLPENDREKLDQAIQDIAFEDLGLDDLLVAGKTGDALGLAEKIRQTLDGKTGAEILAQAQEIRAERERKEREQALQEIQELRSKASAAEQAAKELKAFQILRSRFYKRPQRYGRPEPIIELTVVNGTKFAISRAYFRGTIASSGRAVPWLRDEFNYSISGGLEPGERATWKLAPNTFSDWGRVDAPPDAVFTVEVIKLDGPDNQPVLDAEGLSDFEKERLAKLEEEFQS